VCLEAEDRDVLLLGLVQLAELLAELVLGHVRAVGVENIATWQPSDLVDRNYCQYRGYNPALTRPFGDDRGGGCG
jgi:hypothetical protein